MGVRERSPGRHTVSMYEPSLGRKVHVGTFRSRERALQVEALAKAGEYERPAPRPRCPDVQGPVVYFIAAPSLGLVKIGYTRGLRQRFGELSRGSPVDIAFVHALTGNRTLERELHARFADYRSRGEWFRHEGALAEHLTYLVEAR